MSTSTSGYAEIRHATSAARQAVRDMAAAEAKLDAARNVRINAIRRLKAAGLTTPEISEVTGINFHTVKLDLERTRRTA